jgi:hypothetical protein
MRYRGWAKKEIPIPGLHAGESHVARAQAHDLIGQRLTIGQSASSTRGRSGTPKIDAPFISHMKFYPKTAAWRQRMSTSSLSSKSPVRTIRQ